MNRHLRHLAIVGALLALVVGCGMGTGAQTQPSAPAGQAPASSGAAAPDAVTTGAPATAGGATAGASAPDLSVRDVAARVRPAVVQIATEQANPRLSQTRPGAVLEGIGSGVIFDTAGHILTNNHVIDGAQSISVALPDGRTFDGQLVARDPLTDLAVVQIQGSDLPVATLGASNQLAVGDGVVAIGNALGLPGGPTVTAGVVSALGRTVSEPGATNGAAGPRLYDVIQTDAAINPGNSGGPLVNRQAEVIGINTLVAGSDDQGNPTQGIGFAIAIDTAKPIADQLIASGHAQHAYLGIAYDWVSGASARQTSNAATPGVLVVQVQSGSPAAKAGLRPGDLITQVNGQPLKDETTLPKDLSQLHPGDTLQLTITRGNAQQTVAVTLADRATG
jgi:S1-C subfamily serine protease